MSKRIGKNLKVGGETLVSEAAWNAELESKHNQLVEWLKANKLAGVLLRRSENIAWVTGGAVELRVLTPCETGVGSVLVTADGKRYYFTSENEGPRLHDEEFGALDFEPVLFPWWGDDTNGAAAKLAGGPLGSDSPGAGTHVSLAPLRAALSESEIARYRWLGAETAAATVEALHQVEPGLSEYDLEAITESGLLRRGILPSVALYAVDELSGFVLACAYVRPDGLVGMTPKSVKKKLKTPSFAAAVNRDEMRRGAEELGVDFDAHLQIVITALTERRDQLMPASS